MHLKHGEFYIKNILIKPLTINEINEGWVLVLPKPNKKYPIFHFNINIIELPFYLKNKILNNKVKNKIYYYTINNNNKYY
jgi:hypothetical protein